MPKKQEITVESLKNMLAFFPDNRLLHVTCDAIETAKALEENIKTKDSEYCNHLQDFYKGCKREIKFSRKKCEDDLKIKSALLKSCIKTIIFKLCDYYEEQIVSADRISRNGLSCLAKKTGIALRKWARSLELDKDENFIALWGAISNQNNVGDNFDTIIDRLISYITNSSDTRIDRCEDIDNKIKEKKNIERKEKLAQWTVHTVYKEPQYKRKRQDANENEEYVNISSWLYFFRIKENISLQLHPTRPDGVIDPRPIIKRLRR